MSKSTLDAAVLDCSHSALRNLNEPFPPTLIQAATRELFLSQAVRQYQAIRSGGHEAILDVYEGMPHVFQAVLWGSPEAKTAVEREAAFFKKKLLRPAKR